jgi:molybdopterin molybdotransferase
VDAPRRGVAAADLPAALAELVPPPGTAREVPLAEADGRVCARDVPAPHSLPPFPTARVDGYAARSFEAGRRLRVTGRAFPGDPPPPRPGPEEALFVMTGAPLPEGIAGVVPREGAEADGGDVVIRDPAAVPAVQAGARVAAGEALVRAGATIGPDGVGRLADFGIAQVAVYPRPTVDILAIGDELREVGQAPPPGAGPPHYNSNGPVLAALARAVGAVPRVLPPAPDDPDRIARALADSGADVAVTTGGTARGAHDHTAAAVAKAGFAVAVEGIAARPAQGVRIATAGDRVLLALPGSGGAVAPLFALLVGPVLALRGGRSDPGPRWHTARLADTVAEARPMPLLAHAELALADGAVTARPARGGGNGFVLLPEGTEPVPAGTFVPALFAVGAFPA